MFNAHTHARMRADAFVCVCCDAAIMYLEKTITGDNKNECTSRGGHVASGDDISISSVLHRDLFVLVWILVRIVFPF